MRYRFRYWYEWGCGETYCPCLWSCDDYTKEAFGYVVDINALPISDKLKHMIFELGKKHDAALDWDYPPDPLLWTKEEEDAFYKGAHEAYDMLIKELGNEYEIEYCECR